MASLVCWASGLLEIMLDKDVDTTPSGPVVLMRATAGRLTSLVSGHAERDATGGRWYVPESREAKTQDECMTLVIAFNKKLNSVVAKRKGLKHLKLVQGGQS